jgi:predicted lipoprotein with Yx(FWY)xxD motif
MKIYGRLGCVTITLAALAGTAACGAQGAVEFIKPVAATSTPSAPEVPLQGAGPAESSDTAPKVKAPTLAKTQKWVKIFSGPSDKTITPPASIRTCSHTVELKATLSTQFGTYVADGAGRTLYRFDNDSAKPPKSTCNGDCAKTWPPLLIKSPGKIFPTGINPEILGYVERADGHCQVTINGWPVYYYSGDKAAGEFKGQGIKGTWFAVTPTGGKTHNLLDDPLPTAPAQPGN